MINAIIHKAAIKKKKKKKQTEILPFTILLPLAFAVVVSDHHHERRAAASLRLLAYVRAVRDTVLRTTVYTLFVRDDYIARFAH
jgi:hypothetical protein